MLYTITKRITAKKQSSLFGFYRGLIILIAIPVIAIALLSFVLLFVFSQVQSWFIKRGNEPPAEPYHLELSLLNSEHVKIFAIEDESDNELALLNELWEEQVYHEETYLYRAKTFPVIPDIDGKIICFYVKEQAGGAILQMPVINDVPSQLPGTQLVYLQYNNLLVTVIEDIGPFYLFNEGKDNDFINGFNEKEELTICLAKSW